MRGLAYLERYPVVHSRDSEFARDKLYSAYGATGFEARNDGFGIRANFAQLTSIGLAFCSYNSAVSLSFPEADFVRQFFFNSGGREIQHCEQERADRSLESICIG